MTDQQITIPTLPDLMHGIEQWMTGRADGADIPADLKAEVDRLLDTPPSTADDLFKLIAFARGCHTVAEERRARDDDGTALCFHYFGQIMLEEAVRLIGRLAVVGIHELGETRH